METELQTPKKRGIIARFFLFLVLPITAPFILLKALALSFMRFLKGIRRSLPDNIKEIRGNINDAKNVMQDHQFKFEEILRRWGIEDDEIPSKIREAYFHTACWGATSAVAFSAMFIHKNILSLVICGSFIVAVLGTLSSLWKADVLKERHYIHFFDWLRFWN